MKSFRYTDLPFEIADDQQIGLDKNPFTYSHPPHLQRKMMSVIDTCSINLI